MGMHNLESIKKNILGNTGLEVSKIGLGTVKFGRNIGVKYPQNFNIPDDQSIKKLLALAKELNINLLDTAPAYGSSEERLGKILKKDRQNWIISSKVGEEFNNNQSTFNFTKKAITDSIHRSLKRLNTDYLDILLIHSDGNDEEIIDKYNAFDTLINLKQQGLIRNFGMSSKTIAGGLLTVKMADVVMVEYNSNHLEETSVIEEAYKLNKGVLIKKALRSGHLDVATNMNLILKTKGVHSIIIGTINPTHLIENVRFAMLAERQL